MTYMVECADCGAEVQVSDARCACGGLVTVETYGRAYGIGCDDCGPDFRPLCATCAGPRPVKGPGKFEGQLEVARWIWEGDDGEALPVDTGDCAIRRYDAPLAGLSDRAELLSEGYTPGDCEFLRTQAGCILTERSDGFVLAEWFRTREALESAWKNTTREWEDSARDAREYEREVDWNWTHR